MTDYEIRNEILNEKEALERFGGDKELYTELLQMFITEPQFSLQSVKDLLAADRIQESASEIHRLKGTAGTIGAEKLYAACTSLEAVLRGKKEGNVESLLNSIEKYYEEVNNVIKVKF